MATAPLQMGSGMNLHSPRLWTLAVTSPVVLGALVTLAAGSAVGSEPAVVARSE